MGCIRRVGMVLVLVVASASGGEAQGVSQATREAYFGAVAEFFELPRSEVSILGEWRLPADEIPVVLFLARRAGISPEALVALRGSGEAWAELVVRYRVDASHFHVPLPDGASPGRLGEAYRQYRSLPAERWREVTLGDGDIVGLVNVRVLSQTLKRAPEEVLAGAGSGSWAELYGRLVGGTP